MLPATWSNTDIKAVKSGFSYTRLRMSGPDVFLPECGQVIFIT